jgi:hypothetical protein
MNKTQRSRLIGAFLAIIGVLGLTEAQAQMPARFYLKSLSDANAVPVIFNSISGNTNPFDPAHTVTRNSTRPWPWPAMRTPSPCSIGPPWRQ